MLRSSLLRPLAEQASRELAHKFAKKCFSPLEITHFKDVFYSLADKQDGINYWKEETLCRFLGVPDVIGVGPVICMPSSPVSSRFARIRFRVLQAHRLRPDGLLPGRFSVPKSST